MSGSISKRCPCPVRYGPSGKRLACRKDHGSWTFVVGLRDPASGKRRQVRQSGYRTREDAERALADLVSSGIAPARRNETFETYARDWLEARRRKVRANTAVNYETGVDHACRVFGATPLGDVTRRDVETLAHGLADAGRAQRTVALVLFVVRSVLAAALDDGLVSRNVAAKVEASGTPARERTALSAGDLTKLRAHVATDRLGACWLLSLLGLRRSELLGLRWSDLDLTAGTVTVDHAVVADAITAKRSESTPPKTRRGYRTLPLPAEVLDALRGLKDRQAAEFGPGPIRTGYLVVDETGEPYRPERWSDEWRQLCRAAGVSPVTLHTARHSSVTAMRAAGVADDVVAKWHGHDETIMRRTYTHPDTDALAAAGQALADVLGGKAAPIA